MTDTSIAGKTILSVKSLSNPKESYRSFFFASEDMPKFELKDASVKAATFANISMKGAVFKDVNFSYTVFNNCYFRCASFYNCNFTGCKFIDSNFKKVTMVACDFSYSEWSNTYIERGPVLANLPSYDNLAQELLINMRINAVGIGEYEDARQYIYESEKKSRRYNWKKFIAHTDYSKKYTADQRLKALYNYLRSHAERIFWGYGEKVFNLFLTTLSLIVAFGLIYFLKAQSYFVNGEGVLSGVWDSIKLSFAVFTSFNLIEVDEGLKSTLYNWFLLEAISGVIFIGFLAASLHRKISMRRD